MARTRARFTRSCWTSRRSHPLVLKNPEPFVAFTAFGATSMNFEIRVFLADVGNGGSFRTTFASVFWMRSSGKDIGIAIPAPAGDGGR